MNTVDFAPIAPRHARLPWPFRPLSRIAVVAVWYDRWTMRQHLAELDDHMLDDIGLDRETVRREAAKPFWVT